MNKKIIIFLSVLFLIFPSYAETIKLKNGNTVRGRILEKSDRYIKVDIAGIPITYYFDEIESIDGQFLYIVPQASSLSSYSSSKQPQDIFKNVSPAIVYITTKTLAEEEFLGSGFILDSDGVIVTNYHVIRDAKEINVKMRDGAIYPVNYIIYYDANRDLCLFKIDARNLPVIPLGDSNALQIGEKIYVIGNPLGLEYTFSDGMLSGMRDFQSVKLLQFTAPISPGNSGGPILNSQGQAIGVVTSFMKEGQNLNFALAINEVKPFITTTPKMSFKQFVESVSQADYYIMQGFNYELQGDHQQALSFYRKALEINPNSAKAYNGLGYVYDSLGQYQEAISYYEKALQIDPSYATAYNNLAFAYGNLGEHQKSIPYYEKALQLDPNLAIAYGNLAFAYFQLGQPEQSIFYLQKNIQINPNDATAHNLLGFIYIGLGQNQQAISYLERALQIDPNYAKAYANFGYLYNNLGQFEQAIFYSQRAIQLDSNIPAAYDNLGYAYHHVGKYTEAKDNLERAKELYQRYGDHKSALNVEKYLQENF
jgi:tetratricopeptide (TPR) repeat protein